MSASLAEGHAQLWIDALHNVLALPAAPMIELVQASGTSGITEFMKDTAAFQDMLMRLSLCPLSPSNLLSIHRTALRLCMVDTEVIRLDLPESRLVDTLQHMSRLLTTAMKVAVAARQPCRRVWSEESCAKILLGYMEKMLQKDLSEPIRKALADLMASAMTFFNVNLDVIPLAVSSRLGLRPCPYDATYGRRLSQRQRDKEWEYEVEQIALDTKDFRRTELVCMGCGGGPRAPGPGDIDPQLSTLWKDGFQRCSGCSWVYYDSQRCPSTVMFCTLVAYLCRRISVAVRRVIGANRTSRCARCSPRCGDGASLTELCFSQGFRLACTPTLLSNSSEVRWSYSRSVSQ